MLYVLFFFKCLSNKTADCCWFVCSCCWYRKITRLKNENIFDVEWGIWNGLETLSVMVQFPCWWSVTHQSLWSLIIWLTVESLYRMQFSLSSVCVSVCVLTVITYILAIAYASPWRSRLPCHVGRHSITVVQLLWLHFHFLHHTAHL